MGEQKIDLRALERKEEVGAVVSMLRAYRRNAAAYYAHHAKLKGDEGCVCCSEHERLERLFPQFMREESDGK